MNRILISSSDTYPLYNITCTSEAQPDAVIGLIYIISGIIYQMFYLPCLLVIGREEQARYSCFKIMFYLGIVDNLCLILNSTICGYFSLSGISYCDHPKLMYVWGCFALSLWCNNCATCILLAINRCVDLWRYRPLVKLFEGNRTWFLLLFALLYSLYFFFFTNPLIYSVKYHTSFFDPFVDTGLNRTGQFSNVAHSVNNYGTVLVLSTLYAVLCSKIMRTSKKASFPSTRIVGRMQKQIFFQSFIICMINMSAALLYVYMQDKVVSRHVYIFAQLTWQASHGSISFVYLTMNQTIRKGVFAMFLSERIEERIQGLSLEMSTKRTERIPLNTTFR